MKRVHYKVIKKSGPDACTVCTVFHPMDGGYISQSFEFNHHQSSPELIHRVIQDCRAVLRSTAKQVEDFAKRFERTTVKNAVPQHTCK